MIDEKTGSCIFRTRAHSGEITDIAVYEGKNTIIASSGRDRTIQVFQRTDDGWDLSQTLDEHVGAVTGLLFTSDGSHLLSCSSDRTVVVREALAATSDRQASTAFVIVRTITMRNTPVSMTLPAGVDDFLILSTTDRSVHKYNFRTGQLSNTFKASDTEGGDAVVISSLVQIPNATGQHLIAGVSSTDKSLRLYDENGILFGRDWGHTEGVTDLTLVSSDSDSAQRCLVSVAADGTVFIWNIDFKEPARRDISQSMDLAGITSSGKDLLSSKPPLRRILSQSEMAKFQPRTSGEDVSTPTGRRTVKLEKRTSRFSLAQAPKLEPVPMNTYDADGRRRTMNRRSPSPPTSPRNTQRVNRRPSLDPRARTKSGPSALSPNPFSLSTSTDQVCRSLRSYRKKLASSADEPLAPEALRELERELGLTARALGEKAMKSRGQAEETVMVKLLSQYSERLLEMLDEKFAAATIAPQAKVGADATGSASPSSIDEVDDAGDEQHATLLRSQSVPNASLTIVE